MITNIGGNFNQDWSKCPPKIGRGFGILVNQVPALVELSTNL
jgi:hypothetical protein